MRQLLFLVLSYCAICYPAFCAEAPDALPNKAIQLVLETQQEKIRSVDKPDEWEHDTKERSWSVKRPASPGLLDTTHTFTVTYKIEGVSVASWRVDTRTGTAVSQP